MLSQRTLSFNLVRKGMEVLVFTRPKTIPTGREPRQKPRRFGNPDEALNRLCAGKVTEKTETYFKVGGTTILKKDVLDGAMVVVRSPDPNPRRNGRPMIID